MWLRTRFLWFGTILIGSTPLSCSFCSLAFNVASRLSRNSFYVVQALAVVDLCISSWHCIFSKIMLVISVHRCCIASWNRCLSVPCWDSPLFIGEPRRWCRTHLSVPCIKDTLSHNQAVHIYLYILLFIFVLIFIFIFIFVFEFIFVFVFSISFCIFNIFMIIFIIISMIIIISIIIIIIYIYIIYLFTYSDTYIIFVFLKILHILFIYLYVHFLFYLSIYVSVFCLRIYRLIDLNIRLDILVLIHACVQSVPATRFRSIRPRQPKQPQRVAWRQQQSPTTPQHRCLK